MSDLKQLSKLADSALGDPIVLHKLCERILELMREDIRNQRDRDGYSRRMQ